MDESRVTRYATEKYVDKNNISDSDIDTIFDKLSMIPIKRYKINYDYDKSACNLNPAPSYIYEDEEVCIIAEQSEDCYILQLITVMQGKNDITDNVVNRVKDTRYRITLKSVNDDINIKIITSLSEPS